MFQSIRRHTAVGVWVAALVAIAGVGALSGVSITVGASLLWLVACVVPPAVTLMVWNGAPPPRILDACRKLRERGLVRYLAVSTVAELEACEYPDSQKILVSAREPGQSRLRKIFRAEATVDYYDREET